VQRVLQCVAVCCSVSVLQYVAACCSVRNALLTHSYAEGVAVCCSVLQRAGVLQYVARVAV